jgi:hypothetical protein
MKRRLQIVFAVLVLASAAGAQSQVPAGTRFLVELRNQLEAHKAKRGKKFEARTLEALTASDGRIVPAGAKVRGRVGFVERSRMVLRFEQIETPRGKQPLVATLARVVGERHVDVDPNREGEIRVESSRGRDAAIGAAVVGGIGAAVGAAKGGGRGGAVGAASGAAAGAAIGAAAGGRDLVLPEGARLELRLDRPLTLP